MPNTYKPSQMASMIKRITPSSEQIEPDRPSLSDEYQEVEYIGFDGASFFSDRAPIDIFLIIVDAEQNELNTASLIFGEKVAWVNGSHDFNFGSTGSNQRWYQRAGLIMQAPIEIEGKRVKSKAIIGHYYSTSYNPITVGCYNNSQYFKGKLYKLAMLNPIANSWARYWVPCYRASDGVIGLCDVVTNTFYTNEGSGSFTKGPDVN